MKNIHLLPTDKPSRLAGSEYITNEQGIDKRAFKLKLWNKIISNKDLRDIGYIPQNTYITNDEKIKVGDWYLIEFNGLKITQCNSVEELISIEGRDDCKKIILADNPDLIEDGVQAIDDTFLEWFVKNPSCERAEVVKGKMQLNDDGQEYGFPDMSLYKIIIPQEEPKQDSTLENAKLALREYLLTNKEKVTEDLQEMREKSDSGRDETLEEAANRLFYTVGNEGIASIDSFMKGANYQAERMYSEEDMIAIVEKSRKTGLSAEYLLLTEQFKKK